MARKQKKTKQVHLTREQILDREQTKSILKKYSTEKPSVDEIFKPSGSVAAPLALRLDKVNKCKPVANAPVKTCFFRPTRQTIWLKCLIFKENKINSFPKTTAVI